MRERKVRGLRRWFRWFEQQADGVAPLNREALDRWQYGYARASTGPWIGMSYASNPPAAFQREALRGLLRTQAHWQTQLADSPEPYYLAVWFFELEFRETQLVAAFGQRKERYERLFGEPLAPQPPLPTLISLVPGAEQLAWKAYDHVPPAFTASDFPPATLARLLRRLSYFAEEYDGDTQYYLYRGLVWVGTVPA